MNRNTLRPAFFLGSLLASGILMFATGCASGGFKLTRQYASLVNRQHIIIRIILYLVTGIVFFITLLADVVINNTIDFWEGKVSAGDFNFKNGEKTYFVRHEFLPETHLRQSTIRIADPKGLIAQQEIILRETAKGEIEMYVDGKLRNRVHDISSSPIATVFDSNGQVVREEQIPVSTSALAGI